jgi:alginate production protein
VITVTGSKVGLTHAAAFIAALAMSLPAVAADGKETGARSGAERSIKKRAADGATEDQLAQFTVPRGTPGSGTRPEQVPGALRFEYLYGTELEIPYFRNRDLNSSNPDDSLDLAPTVFGAVTYRPVDWLETRLEMTLEKIFHVRGEEVVVLPDGTLQNRDPTPWSLLVDQLYAKVKAPTLPVEFTVGRRNYEDQRLWLYDAALDAVILGVKPGDFNIEMSVSRENFWDLDLLTHVPRGEVTNYIGYAEYRGIEDHRLAGYYIYRKDAIDQEGRPQFIGVRAIGRPYDSFNYWTELARVGGEDENRVELSGTAYEVGGTYRFLGLPLQPSITLGYAYGSGDDSPGDGKNNEFRQTGLQSNEARFGGVTQFKAYGEALDPELSNLRIYTAGVGFRPSGSVFVDLVYHRYRLAQLADQLRSTNVTALMNQIPTEQSKDVGNEIDVIVGFRNLFGIRGFGFETRAGWFLPGNAFRTDLGGGPRDADPEFSLLGVFFY